MLKPALLKKSTTGQLRLKQAWEDLLAKSYF
jgi:hypothetical protein